MKSCVEVFHIIAFAWVIEKITNVTESRIVIRINGAARFKIRQYIKFIPLTG